MGEFARILGFDKRQMWWYRDIALTTIAAISTLWAIAGVMVGDSAFDKHLAIGSALIAVLCCIVTPNRLIVFGAVVGIVAMQGWFAVTFSGDSRSWSVAVPATILEVGFILKYRNRPIIRR